MTCEDMAKSCRNDIDIATSVYATIKKFYKRLKELNRIDEGDIIIYSTVNKLLSECM